MVEILLDTFGHLPRYPRAMSVPAVFEWHAREYADRYAIFDDEERLTYGELDLLSNRLARQLIARGLSAGDFVATVTTRSIETVVLWLAILKSGGVYLPIDPLYPPATIAMMLEDAQPRLVVADGDYRRSGIADISRCIVDLEQIFTAAYSQSEAPVVCSSTASSPAYVMYTSGSTGRPKGVIVPHRAIVRLVRDQTYVRFSERDVFLQISALAFDACTWEIWGALLNGASVAIVSGARLSIPAIAAAIARHGVTSMFFTSALFNAIVDIDIDCLEGLEQIMVGGDVVSPQHVSKAMERFPKADFINGYGPTEATTFSVCYRMPRNGSGDDAVPIGLPLNNTYAYVLSPDRQRVPAGETGQLWIGGDGVALGYLKREELTAERFRPDPFASDADARMYDTGDFARVRSDGLLEFFGRNDRQVKIDGKRIELDEIEHAIRKCASVADTVVAIQTFGPSDKQIVAFIKTGEVTSQKIFASRLSDELRQLLPQHMIPARIVAVVEFPLTVNGKIDKTALMQLVGHSRND